MPTGAADVLRRCWGERMSRRDTSITPSPTPGPEDSATGEDGFVPSPTPNPEDETDEPIIYG